MRILILLLLIVGIAAGGTAYYTQHAKVEKPIVYRTAPIERGDLTVTISATGTVQPEEVIDVGAQVAGKVESFGRDPANPEKPIDFCSVVHEGTVLANIDPTYYKAQVDQAEAALQRAEADLTQLHAKLEQTEQEWKRAEILRPKKAIADSDYDLAVANYHMAKANVAVGEAAKRQAAAALSMAQTNLGYTVIKSPVEGVIIARRVNVGQTVVASLNAPSLFLIAKDLRRMQVWASVNEADIGQIRTDMPVRFTVDAFPGETFHGKVTQIRMNAQMTQNIVLYTVVVTTDNSDMKLLPYLTANLRFEVARHKDVFLAPNAALRWRPGSVAQIAPDAVQSAALDNQELATGGKAAESVDDIRRLWVAEGNYVRPLDVIVGPTDGQKTQIHGDGVKEGVRIVIGEGGEGEIADEGATTNPFLPKFPNRKRAPPPP